MYVFHLARTLIHEKACHAIAVILAISLFLPLLIPSLLFGAEIFRINMRSALDAYTYNEQVGTLDSLPPEMKELEDRSVEYIDRALSSSETGEFYRAFSAYCRIQMNLHELGYLSGGAEYDRASLAFSDRMLSEHIEREPLETSQLPVLYHLPYALVRVPSPLLFAPAIVVALSISHVTQRSRLLGHVPARRLASINTKILVGVPASIVLVAIAYVPSFVYFLIANGMGHPGYPVVYMRGAELVDSAALIAYFQGLALLILGNVFCVTLALCIDSVTSRPYIGGTLSMFLVVVPLAAGYYESSSWMRDVVPYAPISYLVPSAVLGYVGRFPTADSPYLSTECTADLGIAVLSLGSIAAYVAAFLIGFARDFGIRSAEQGCHGLVFQSPGLRYGTRTIIKNVVLQVETGFVYGLVAPNGAGKTTLLNALSGERRVQKGSFLSADGVPSSDGRGYRQNVFHFSGDAVGLYPSMSVRWHLQAVRDCWNSPCSIEEALQRVNISDMADLPARKLSQGMRQQVLIALAYASHAAYVLFDEPTNALDPSNVKIVNAALRSMVGQGRCIILSSHMIDSLKSVADKYIYIVDDQLIQSDTLGPDDFSVVFRSARNAGKGKHFANDGRSRSDFI
ncbi:ABC transporter ATP-binding protein [Collinsella tanakaei]|uniref:ATP-binding cassette domain-containing protein n=1 Tax=Collinsella tanakaei TaxID=626935 RepID=UPI001959FFAE|nr:ABC transporter ATP-binding protein [Collinsella tanakaei]MBM6756058.1 ABC transporter ATP-binding protein [Collinsella tanakaei]